MLGLAIGAGVQALGSLVGGLVTRGRQKRREREIDNEQNMLDKWYRQSQNSSYMESENAKATLSMLHRQNRRTTEQLNNNLIRGGATAESRVATAAALNENYADTVSKLAIADQSRKERDRERYIEMSERLASQRGGYASSPGDYIAAATQSVGESLTSLWGNDALKLPRKRSWI